MNDITIECRNESYELTDKQKRCKDILFVLTNSTKPLTASEIAEDLYIMGKVNRCDRNITAPRLTEMCEKGIVAAVDKKLDTYTGRRVSCYQIAGEVNG